MKKTSIMIAWAIALGLVSMPTAHVLGADDGSQAAAPTSSTVTQQSTTSKATFEVTGGALTLEEVPSFKFGSIGIQDLAADKPASVTGTGSGNLKVSDYRGTNAGWTVSANLGDFQNGKETLKATSVTLAAGKIQTDNNAVAIGPNNIQGADTPVWGAAVGDGAGVTTVSENAATLNLLTNKKAVAGTYIGTITWTLSATPTSTTTAK